MSSNNFLSVQDGNDFDHSFCLQMKQTTIVYFKCYLRQKNHLRKWLVLHTVIYYMVLLLLFLFLKKLFKVNLLSQIRNVWI